jgi:DHA2 family multidrug resistance protein
LTRGLVEQSYLLSSLDYFYVSAWITLGMIGIVWFARRPRVASGVAAAAE